MELFALGVIVVLVVAGFGAVTAGIRATDPGNTTGRKVELWTLAVILTVVVLLVAAGAYWFWRFTVEFSF